MAKKTTAKADPPVKVIRYGSVRGNVWKRMGQHGPIYSVSVDRLYKDESDGAWKSGGSFGRGDLLELSKVSDQCHTWICRREDEERERRRDGGGA